MRHLPADRIEQILPCISDRHLQAGKILFSAGDPGDALHIVARGTVDVLANPECGIAKRQEKPSPNSASGKAFGEMSLLSGGPRTATIRAAEDTRIS